MSIKTLVTIFGTKPGWAEGIIKGGETSKKREEGKKGGWAKHDNVFTAVKGT